MTEQEKRLHRCCFTGHRPEKLFLVDREIIKELESEIKAAIERGYTTFISGMARGVDIWAAEIVLNLRKKNKNLHLICASPYEGFESRWSQDWQKRYKKIIKKADYVKYVSPEYSPACFQIRNEYMVNHSNLLILGKKRVSTIKKSDIKTFYNYLADQRYLQAATIDNIHTVIHQVFQLAVDDDYIRNNPTDNVLKELKKSHVFQTEKRRALTKEEQDLFLNYLRNNHQYNHWYPLFAVMLGTGLRVGELTGLRWCDLDFDEGLIDINHTLVYYCHREEVAKNGCYFNINTPKTKAGNRQVPMIDSVREAFLMERDYQEKMGISCNVVIDGYTDFVFLNKNGKTYQQGTLNKAIRRIIRDCNDEELLKDENATVLLPHFSCHSLRHSFATRMCEAGINIKVMQDTLGHNDISTTMNIYTDATKALKKSEFQTLETYLIPEE